MAWEISWADMCRVCMEVDGDLLSLFDGKDEFGSNGQIVYKIAQLAAVEIDKFDGLPTKICDKCAYRIDAFYDFKCLIEESDRKLRQMFNDQVAVDEKANQRMDEQINNTYVTSESQLQVNQCLAVKDETSISFNGSNKIQILLQAVDDQGCDVTTVDGLENVCNNVVLNVQENIDSSDIGAKLDNLHVVFNSQELNVLNNSNESQFVENLDICEFQQPSTLSSKVIEFDYENDHVINSNSPQIPGESVEKNKNSKNSTLNSIQPNNNHDNDNNDDSDSDSFIDPKENIVGSINDTITRVKEIKEAGKVVQFQCTLCSHTYKALSEVLIHIVDLHVPITGPFYCVVCEMDCDSIKHLKAHVKTHKGPSPYSCFLCNKSYVMKRYLKRHMACHTDFSRFRCTKCGERFKVKNELESHISSSHAEDVTYKCSQCPRVFNHKGNYKRHLISHLDPQGIHLPKYPCSYCKKRFLNNRTLNTHMRVHTGEKPYKCDVCNKAFSQQGNLFNHKRIHINPRCYKCDICGKSFNQKATLRDHGLLHSGEKPYVCTTCGMAFTFSAALRRHMWSHTDGKPYECDICNAKFIGKYDLSRHIKIHSSKPKYKRSKSNKAKESNDKVACEKIGNMVEEPSNSNTIYVEQIFLCDDAIQIISQGDSEKENTETLLQLIQY